MTTHKPGVKSRDGFMPFLYSLFLLGLLLAPPLVGAGNALLNPEFVVDGLILLEGADELLQNSTNCEIVGTPDGGGIRLLVAETTGSILLRPIETRFPFNEALPSWNGWTPPGGGFRVWMRVMIGDTWSQWIQAGDWGTFTSSDAPRIVTFPEGMYEYDTLLLEKPASQVQFLIDLTRNSDDIPSPVFRLIAVAYTNSLEDKELGKKFASRKEALSIVLEELETTETLPIPFCSQLVGRDDWIGQICSPVSVCMALRYFGVDKSCCDICASIYDPAADMFGIWHRSVQDAAQEGVRGYVRRFRYWDDVRHAVNHGVAICASIRFSRDEVEQPPRIYSNHGTGGHLIVIKGFAPGGRVVVQDSASSRYGADSLWLQSDLAKAWFDKGGVAYVFTPPRNTP